MKLHRAIALAAVAIFSGCDTSTSSDATEAPATTKILPAGARILTVSGHVRDSTGNVRVAVRGHLVKPDASGNYTFIDTIVPATARALATDTASAADIAAPRDTARIVVVTSTRTDTLRKVPLTSWSTILSPVSVVANDVSVNAGTGSAISGKVVEAVWWADDTIAHVLRVPNSTSSDYYSTTIYTLYNDSAYAVNGHKYFIFLRAKTAATDTLPVAATSIRDIGAQNGALNYTDTFFHAVYTNNAAGVTLVPADSNATRFGLKHTLTPTGDSLVTAFKPIQVSQIPWTQTQVGSGVVYIDSISTRSDLSGYSKLVISFEIDSATLKAVVASPGSGLFITSLDYTISASNVAPLVVGKNTVTTKKYGNPAATPLATLVFSGNKTTVGAPVKNLRAVYVK